VKIEALKNIVDGLEAGSDFATVISSAAQITSPIASEEKLKFLDTISSDGTL
jgi:hypothetical protein